MKKILFIVIGSLLCCVVSCKISIAKIIIVKSKGDALSYESALLGFKSIVDDVIEEYDLDYSVEKGYKIVKKIKKLLRSKNPPVAIATIGYLATKLISEEITDIPVIFCMVINPAKKANANVGGVTFTLSSKHQLAGLKEVLPKAKNIGVIYNPKNTAETVKTAKEIAPSLGINIIAKSIRSAKETPLVIKDLINEIDVLWVIPDSTVLSRESFKFINMTALNNCIPVMSCSPQLVEIGSPFSFFTDAYSVGRQAGKICRKILTGEIIGPIPIEYPNEIFLAINLVTMKRCGIVISQETLESARYIYK